MVTTRVTSGRTGHFEDLAVKCAITIWGSGFCRGVLSFSAGLGNAK